MQDRRKSPRLRSLKRARIVFSTNWPAIDCLVRNLSPVGACVEIEGEFTTTPDFKLAFPQENERRACRQIWRQGNRVGVAFG